MIRRLPRAKTLRQISPRRAAAQHPEQRVGHLARRAPRSARACQLRQQRLDQGPLFVRQFVAAHQANSSAKLPCGGTKREAYYVPSFSDTA